MHRAVHAATSEQHPLPHRFLQGGGAMGARIRGHDWSQHPLGPADQWPDALRMAISLCLNASFPTAIYWGPQLHLLYNDAWSAVPADKHPWALGRTAQEVWPDIWDIVGPQLHSVLETGQPFALYEQMLPMERGGKQLQTWWNYSLTAIRNADHSIGGIFNQGHEITEVVEARSERQAELQRWRELFRQAPAPVAWLRGPDHVFEFANEAYTALVGGREVAGRRVADALPEIVEQGFLSLLDGVFSQGEPHVGSGTKVMLRRRGESSLEERIVDYVYQPVRAAAGHVDGIFVLVLDVTERARAEAALRLSNWQLGEERARLASTVEAEQRARTALRRFSDALEAEVQKRTAQLRAALEAQASAADQLRAAFATPLIYQGFLDTGGRILNANETALKGIRGKLSDVLGTPFWDSPWFSATPGMAAQVREAVAEAARGREVHVALELELPIGRRRFDFHIRPVVNDSGQIIGLVPEAVDTTAHT